MYASKTPRDLNHDTHPWLHDHHWSCSDNGGRFTFNNGIGNVFAPRPEFDHVQHNEPNRILVLLRLNCSTPEQDGWDSRVAARYFLDEVGLINIERESLPMAQHAHRVLTRLVALA